jgi:hypothetical protein
MRKEAFLFCYGCVEVNRREGVRYVAISTVFASNKTQNTHASWQDNCYVAISTVFSSNKTQNKHTSGEVNCYVAISTVFSSSKTQNKHTSGEVNCYVAISTVFSSSKTQNKHALARQLLCCDQHRVFQRDFLLGVVLHSSK